MIRLWTVFVEICNTRNMFVMCLECGIVYDYHKFLTMCRHACWIAGTKVTVTVYYHTPSSSSSVIRAYLFQLYVTSAVGRVLWDN
jgi:hypothetical protein